jgi:dihydroxyacid dehydratase/phosphogluconate dehydratase
MGAGLGKDVALITDGRFSGASHVSIPNKNVATTIPYS